jgi:iron complex transport system ATP-binding protein
VVLTTHDIDLAAKHATRIAVLHGGSVVADGPPADVLTSELLSAVYRCRIDVGRHPIDGRPVIFR